MNWMMKVGIAVLCLVIAVAVLWATLATGAKEETEGSGGGGGGGSTADKKKCPYNDLPQDDRDPCKNLQVIYENMGPISCKIVPQCENYRKRIMTWPPPLVKYSEAEDTENYVLVMVDPDAPTRSQPIAKYWRHWLVTNVKGTSLKSGKIEGQQLTPYQPPTPPPTTGLHRYQFFVYVQGSKDVSLTPDEEANLGGWNLESFVQRNNLGNPETSTQFMTQNDDSS